MANLTLRTPEKWTYFSKTGNLYYSLLHYLHSYREHFFLNIFPRGSRLLNHFFYLATVCVSRWKRSPVIACYCASTVIPHSVSENVRLLSCHCVSCLRTAKEWSLDITVQQLQFLGIAQAFGAKYRYVAEDLAGLVLSPDEIFNKISAKISSSAAQKSDLLFLC